MGYGCATRLKKRTVRKWRICQQPRVCEQIDLLENSMKETASGDSKGYGIAYKHCEDRGYGFWQETGLRINQTWGQTTGEHISVRLFRQSAYMGQ